MQRQHTGWGARHRERKADRHPDVTGSRACVRRTRPLERGASSGVDDGRADLLPGGRVARYGASADARPRLSSPPRRRERAADRDGGHARRRPTDSRAAGERPRRARLRAGEERTDRARDHAGPSRAGATTTSKLPRNSSSSHTRSRTSDDPSPTPPVNATVSSPPSATAIAPIALPIPAATRSSSVAVSRSA